MKKTIMTVWAFAFAAPSQALPPAALAPALKPVIAEVSQEVFRDVDHPNIRNRAYTTHELRERLQRNIQEQQNALQSKKIAVRLAGLQERVREEAGEFLKGLSPEVDRLAKESRDMEEFRTRLAGFSSHINSWAVSAKTATAPPGQFPPTEEDIQGPFYRPNAPFTTTLTPGGVTGIAVQISGQIRGTDGQAIAGALVDVWQADPDGNYDIADPKDSTNPKIPYLFRARMRADAAGHYSYTTVLPGQYEIGEGKWRPKHIHYKVTAAGYRPLTTQLYFEGDSYNASDPWWKASNTIPIQTLPGNRLRQGVYAIVLRR